MCCQKPKDKTFPSRWSNLLVCIPNTIQINRPTLPNNLTLNPKLRQKCHKVLHILKKCFQLSTEQQNFASNHTHSMQNSLSQVFHKLIQYSLLQWITVQNMVKRKKVSCCHKNRSKHIKLIKGHIADDNDIIEENGKMGICEYRVKLFLKYALQ